MSHTSLKKFSHVLKQEGTSRLERYITTLHETESLLDTRKLQDFILYMQQYAKNLLFVNTDSNHIDFNESWEDIFVNDPVLLIAGIASVNTANVKTDYDDLVEIFRTEKSIGSFAELTRFVFANFVQVNKWYTLSFTGSLLQRDLKLYIGSYLQKEMERVREMLAFVADHWGDDTDAAHKNIIYNKNEETLSALAKMDALWKLDQKEKLSLREKIFSGNNESEKLVSASIILNKAFETVYHATVSIVEKSGKYFEETIFQKQDHSPHIALIITFIKLFEHEQAELNKIPSRLLNFYYKDVLRIREKEAIPDQAYIVFELVKGFDTLLIKKGTQLSAGKDKQNKALTYETNKDYILNKAKINRLLNFYASRKENGEISNFYTGTLMDNPGQVAANTTERQSVSAKIFDPSGKGQVASIGFAVASSQFYLARGERNVTVILTSPNPIESPEVIQGNKQTTDFDPSILHLSFTGEKGWIKSNDKDSGIIIRSVKKIRNTSIEINFGIAITQPQAIVAFDETLHEGNFSTSFPIMQCLLNFPAEKGDDDKTNALIHQLNILQKLKVSSAEINVQVGTIQTRASFDGVRDLILENDEAVLESKKPFYPFSPVPKVNTSFYIGCNDLYYKKIQSLSINIEWLLPDNFKTYYQKYIPPYDSNKFMASLSYLNENKWKKNADVSVIEVNSTTPRFRNIKMDLQKFLSIQDETLSLENGIQSYDNLKPNGTIRLKLQYPDFGHGVYPQVITSAIMEKADPKSENVNYYNFIKKKFHDDTFDIILPADIAQRKGSLKIIYDVLENIKDDAQARTMLTNALSDIISRNNGIAVIYKKSPDTPADDISEERDSVQIVHDQTFLEKFVLRPLRKLKLLEKDIHDDKDKDSVDDVVTNIQQDIYQKADFILPSEMEMNSLIINEVNKTIHLTAANAIDRILSRRKQQANVSPVEVEKILAEEFDKAREVVNDIIAKKIALSLSASEIPPPPYSPLISSISLNYTSSKKMSRLDDDKLFHLTALGGVIETAMWQTEKEDDSGNTEGENLYKTDYVLPQLLTDKKEMQGMLFIGLSDLLPNENLSLLFQLAEGTKNNDQPPPEIYWFYMRANEWVKLDKDNIISDGTYQLQTTGIIEFSIPQDTDNKNSFFNSNGLYWLCAGIASGADAFPNLTDIKAQAVTVTFIDYLDNPRHMALPLEAQKIKTILSEIDGVKKINQPESSFNGKVDEKQNEYAIRVSERLRHKARAITNWDYESLVLEQFPSLFKVKCLNNYYNGHFATGHVTIVPIANLTNKNYAGSNFLIPKTNYIDLKKIELFLSDKTSPFVKVHALNPKLEHVLVKCKVKFYTGINKGFYLKKLNGDIIEFLTPWATDVSKITFSAKIYASSIISFIDKLDYVDYVQDFVMLQYTENEKGERTYVFDANKLASLVETKLTTDHSLLVSAPKHIIDLADEKN